ncbi:MAG: restriction endonuclease subunit S [Verrucomicrobiia bacterium]
MKNKIELTELHRLFDLKHGNKLDLNKMEQCPPATNAIAFVGRSGERNGIVAFVKKLDDLEPYDSGLITVALGGAALSSFVQPKPFYTAQNIDVLKPRAEMSLDVKLFYCLCIEANRFRYSTFGREANRTLKNLGLPKLECLPQWVNGVTKAAIEELNHDLSEVLRP